MRDIALPRLVDSSGNKLYCTGVHSVSAVSVTGRCLAIALEATAGSATAASSTFNEEQAGQRQQASPGLPTLAAQSSTHEENKLPTLLEYGVAIATSKSNPLFFPSSSLNRTSTSNSKTGINLAPSPDSSDVEAFPTKHPVTSLVWIDDSHLACGLQDGTVMLFVRDSMFGSSRGGEDMDNSWMPTPPRCFHRVSGGTGRDGGSSQVVQLRLSGEGASGIESAAGMDGRESDAQTLWMLYEDRVVVCVYANALIAHARRCAHSGDTASSMGTDSADSADGAGESDAVTSPNGPKSQSPTIAEPSFAKLYLEGQEEVLDVGACPASAGLFELCPDRYSHVIVAAGVSPALAFYPVSSETRSIGLASIAWAVATKVTSLTVGAIDGIFGWVGLGGRSRSRRKGAASTKGGKRKGVKGKEDEQGQGQGQAHGHGHDESPPPIVLRWNAGFLDERRRMMRLCVDPSGRLAAAADGFGRVMLVDCSTRQILRMWKGVRDAECGWLEVEESWEGDRVSTVRTPVASMSSRATNPRDPVAEGGDNLSPPVVGLYLAILAPLRGRVELWRMRHGPCVRTIPAPDGARLLTSRPNTRARGPAVADTGSKRKGEADRGPSNLTSCYLLARQEPGGRGATRLKLSPLSVGEADLAILPTRLSRKPTVDDAYRLRNIVVALTEIRESGTTEAARIVSYSGGRDRLPPEQEEREERLFELLSQVEDVRMLARAFQALEELLSNEGEESRTSLRHPTRVETGYGSDVPATKSESFSSVPAKKTVAALSDSFHRQACTLCRERTDQVETAPSGSGSGSGSGSPGSETAVDSERRELALAQLRFRACAYELYDLLRSVEVQPAGVGGGDDGGDPGFFPPGQRGWKHTSLAEETAAWVHMAKLAHKDQQPRGAPLASAELPDFQEFLGTISLVLEARKISSLERVSTRGQSRRDTWDTSGPLLRFIGDAIGDRVEGGSKTDNSMDKERVQRDGLHGRESSFSSPNSNVSAGGGWTVERPSRGREALTAGRALERRRLMRWVFRPLLSDAFAMASLSQTLSMLGIAIKRQGPALVKDMADWFLTLPVGLAADITVGREAQNCPVLRWLKGIILLAVGSSSGSDETVSGAGRRERRYRSEGGEGLTYDGGGGVGGKLVQTKVRVQVRRGGDRRLKASLLFEDEADDDLGSAGGRSPLGGSEPLVDAIGEGSVRMGILGQPSGGEKGEEKEDEEEEGEKGEVEAEEQEARGTRGGQAAGEDEVADEAGEYGAQGQDDFMINDEPVERNFQAEVETMLRPMYDACASSPRLENALMLAVVAAESLSSSRERLEESSLGGVAIDGGEAWLVLARRIRLCLFLDHRIHLGHPLEDRDRTSARQLETGETSLYAFVAKDQLMSYQDLSFAACSSRENGEIEASSRSQRETAEKKAKRRPAAATGALRPVAAAPTLSDARVDEHWKAVQASAARVGDSVRSINALWEKPRSSTSVVHRLSDVPSTDVTGRLGIPVPRMGRKGHVDGHKSEAVDETQVSLRNPKRKVSPSALFFMRSHAQPLILACHRTRWLVTCWASDGPRSSRAVEMASGSAEIKQEARTAEGSVSLLSVAVDHLSYLSTEKPFLAACVAYWLWEHGGVREHVGELVTWGSAAGSGGGQATGGVEKKDNAGAGAGAGDEAPGGDATSEEAGRPAREAFLAAAEMFLHLEALFPGGQHGGGGGGGGSGSSLNTSWGRRVGGPLTGSGHAATGGDRAAPNASFMSLLTAGAIQQCPWPGAWDLWLEECFREAQVHPPLPASAMAHSTLLRALRVSTVCGMTNQDIPGLFVYGQELCSEGSMRNERLSVVATAPDFGGRQKDGVPGGVPAHREKYIRCALEAIVPRPAQNVYRLARDFGLQEDIVRGWHCLVLLRRGHDVLGEEAMAQLVSLENLAGDILTVMRLRLKRILDYLETSPSTSGGILASLDADTCQWIRSARDVNGASRAAEGAADTGKVAKEPLRSTHGVLLCLARALPRNSRYERQANALVSLLGIMLRHLGRIDVAVLR